MTLDLQTTIEQAWENRANLSPVDASAEVRDAVEHTIDGLDLGRLRVAEKIDDQWIVHQWIKKAVLLSFRLHDNAVMGQGPLQFYDKVPTKFAGYGEAGRGAPRRFHRPQRGADALLRQHRRLCR